MEDLFQSFKHLKRVPPAENLDNRIMDAIRQRKLNSIPYYKVAIAASVIFILSFLEIRWMGKSVNSNNQYTFDSIYQIRVDNNLYNEKD